MSLLEARGISVRFGGHMAVIDADIEVDAGTVAGLIGPNGAGKTTIFNALCGLQELAAGQIRLDGREITSLPPHRRARGGLARTFQRLELFGSLTVRENLQVAAEYRPLGSFDSTAAARRVGEMLALVGLEEIADARADSLPTGKARLVELARALVPGPKVLLLDEPASGLDPGESEAFGGLLERLAVDGLGILLVEHDMSVVMSVCSRIHVLDFGKVIAVGTPEEIRSDPLVLDAYLGSQAR